MLDADVPGPCARGLRASRRPRDLRGRHARALGRAPEREVHVLVTTRGDKGTNDPEADTDALAPSARSRERSRRTGARSRVDVAISATTTASCPTTGRCAPTSCAPSAGCGPTSCSARIRRRCSSATATSIIATTASRVGQRSTPCRPRPATRTTSRSCAPRASTCTSRARCTSRGRSNRTSGSTSGTRSTARSRRCSATRASSTETGEWFRDFLRDSAEAAGRAAGVTYAEGFRRIAIG